MDAYGEYLREKRAAYYAQAKYVEMAIDEVDVSDWRRVLKHRYAGGLLWGEISLRMNASRATCFRYHDKGLEALGIAEGRLADGKPAAAEKDETQ